MDGILNIDKPLGDSSFAIVSRVRRLCRQKRVGHAGTLDPLATGVLPVLVGRATRVTEYLHECPKRYVAQVKMGFTSNSGDADGDILPSGETTGIDAPRISEALEAFRGDIEQIPPMYSALKYQGKPLYKLAREGISVVRKSRVVTIYDIRLRSWDDPFASIEVECSRGTYIRTLAQDLGSALGCGAYLSALCRTAYGPFRLQDAFTMDQLAQAAEDGCLSELVLPVDSALVHMDPLTLSDELRTAFCQGKSLPPDTVHSSGSNRGRLRAYGLDGVFLGVLLFNTEKDEWQPEKVFT